MDARWNNVDGSDDAAEAESDICQIFELPAVHIVGVCGSIRDGSYTKMALTIALEGAAQSRCRVTLVDLAELALPFCEGGYARTNNAPSYFLTEKLVFLGVRFDGVPQDQIPANIRQWREIISSATGVILASPEYHGSYSGVLKNALDLLPNGHLKVRSNLNSSS